MTTPIENARGKVETLVEMGREPDGKTPYFFEARDAWIAAMVAFQRDCPIITRSATAKTEKFAYKYAPLDEILTTIRSTLAVHRLAVTFKHDFSENGLRACCLVWHVGGHVEKSYFAVPVAASGRINAAQEMGVASTYARRYALLAALGLAPEDDTDAAELTSPAKKVRVEPRDKPEPKTLADDPGRDVPYTVLVERVGVTPPKKPGANSRYSIQCKIIGSGEPIVFYTFSETEAKEAKREAGTGLAMRAVAFKNEYGWNLRSLTAEDSPE